MASFVELTFLPGLGDVVTEEARELLVQKVRPVPGRDDAVRCRVAELAPLLSLRTVVAPLLVLTFDVPRPRSLSSGEYFPRIVDAVTQAKRLNSDDPLRTFRIEAAGSDSAVFRRLADQIGQATGLTDDAAGDCVLRFRRAVDGPGWEVLVRLTKRPLATRPWRVRGYPAAVNATIAAAMVRLSRPDPADRVANLMCGSGTLLVERLLAAPARSAVGVDIAADAISASTDNLAAAGLSDRVDLHQTDISNAEWAAGGPFDVIFADPPWGDKTGHHDTNESVHRELLQRAADTCRPGGRLVVLTHEIKVMQRCVRRAAENWDVREELRVFAKGHHPRIYLLQRKTPSQ